MPIPPCWLPRLDQILSDVRMMDSALDRDQIMLLFGLKRREAQRLMARVEPVLDRGRWLVDRESLIVWLEQRRQDAEREQRRRDRLTRGLMAADQALPRPPGALMSIPVTEEMKQKAQALPAGVMLAQGAMVVEFTTLADLAEKLIQTVLALDRNLDHYAAIAEPVEDEQRELERQDAEFMRNWQPEE